MVVFSSVFITSTVLVMISPAPSKLIQSGDTEKKTISLIEEYDSVTVVPPNCKVNLDYDKNIHIDVK